MSLKRDSLLIICQQGSVVSVKSIWNDLFSRRGFVASSEGQGENFKSKIELGIFVANFGQLKSVCVQLKWE